MSIYHFHILLKITNKNNYLFGYTLSSWCWPWHFGTHLWVSIILCQKVLHCVNLFPNRQSKPPRVCPCACVYVDRGVLGNAYVDSSNSPHLVNERWEESVIFLRQQCSQQRDGNVSLSPFLSKKPNGPPSKTSFSCQQTEVCSSDVLCKSLCVAYYQFEQNVGWDLIQWQIYGAGCSASFINIH